MKDFIKELFGLKGFIIYKQYREEGKGLILKVGFLRRYGRCPLCKKASSNIHSRRKQRILHMVSLGERIYLELQRRRFRCRFCKKVFTETLCGLRKWQRKSNFLLLHLLLLLRYMSFSSIEKETGISYSSLRKILFLYNPDEVMWNFFSDGYLKLGIDEHSFRGQRLLFTVTELVNHLPLKILLSSKKETLKEFLESIPEGIKKRIKEVCIDMKELILSSVEESLPEAEIVVDHFHIISDAGRRLDEARRIESEALRVKIPKKIFLKAYERLSEGEKERLNEYLKRYRSLRDFYWVKEKLRSLYRLSSKKEAEREFLFILSYMENSEDPSIWQWRRTLKKWGKYILNFFLSRTTNAYTEGVHTKIKMVKRISFGFRNVEVYRRKVLLSFLPIVFSVCVSLFLT